MNLIEEIYDGELNFEIGNALIESDYISMDLCANYEDKEVGFRVKMPIQGKRVFFKTYVFPDTGRPMQFFSLGESSDRLIKVLEKLWNPDFEVEGKFDTNGVELEYAILNKDIFDCTQEKTFTRLFAYIDMETGDEFDNFNIEVGFNFNLSRKRASIVERKRETRNDFLAILMA